MGLKPGKKTKDWATARQQLKKIYLAKGITTCEVRLPGCMGSFGLSFAHRYKRNDPRCQHSFEQTRLACASCHQKIEYNKELTEKVFQRREWLENT